ncbi:antibiotic biosynthesis monooxygenase [Arthrobacter sp. UCD-GKA]|uniref:antibiotic biosynthesis monooxygenase n=1 Tax=Arthrobacter sp. UCD-GKA TaxID=1913576 RepID=UPI000A589AD4|nr:antibiotic biosynthesis monooxygenase [Arthrobacter sp. UCD-GKA]
MGMPQATPITVSITRTVLPEHHRRFNAWVQAGQVLAREWDGYLGSGWIRTAPDSNEWHVLYRFSSAKALAAWDESEERSWWIDSAAELVEITKVEHRTGIEGWFEQPGDMNFTIAETVVPPRWKQAVSIFLPFFPLSLLSNFLLMPLLGSWPIVLAVLLNICILTPLMTYIFLPVTTQLLRPWLQKPRRDKRRK